MKRYTGTSLRLFHECGDISSATGYEAEKDEMEKEFGHVMSVNPPDLGGKKMLIITPGVPHASVGASTVLFYHYVQCLRRLNAETCNVLLINGDTKNDNHLAVYVSQMSGGSRFQITPVEIDGSFIEFRRFLFEVNERLRRRVTKEIGDFQPDVMVCFDLLSAWLAASEPDSTKVAWLGDLNFQTYWYNALYSVKEGTVRPLKALPYIGLTWAQCRLWKRIYRDVLSRMSSIIVSSKSSEMILNKLGFHAKYLPYPWPKETGSVNGEKKRVVKKPTFLFLGSLKGLGSRSAFHFMIRRLYPRLVDLWGNQGFEIIVAGRGGLYEWVEEELKRRPEFRYIGFAEDIDEVMNSCHAVVVPIDVPVGNRSRIITAMANRTLVIAHANTALANPELVDGKTCLLAKNVEEFVQKMKEAASPSSRILQIVEGGGRVYDENFQPAAACNLFIEEVNKILLARNGWGG